MSYESFCSDLYSERIRKKNEQQAKREQFRQSVIDKQIKRKENVFTGIEIAPELDATVDFIMPDVLPESVDKLKWLIFQNIESMRLHPEREKEYKENIARIKQHIKGK